MAFTACRNRIIHYGKGLHSCGCQDLQNHMFSVQRNFLRYLTKSQKFYSLTGGSQRPWECGNWDILGCNYSTILYKGNLSSPCYRQQCKSYDWSPSFRRLSTSSIHLNPSAKIGREGEPKENSDASGAKPDCGGSDERSPSEPTTEAKDGEKVGSITSAFRTLKRRVLSFTTGIKQLVKDIKLAVQLSKKLREYDYDHSKLSREELFHLKQTKKDVMKTAPVTFFFLLPFIGYLAPVLAYLYPKRLLSRQFWHPEQIQQFQLEDHAKRSQFYLPLVREVGWACKESKDEQLLCLVMKAIDGYHIQNEWLLESKESFEADEAISLRNMPRYHLTKLCKTWMIPATWYMPRKLLIERLRWRVRSILADDDAIRRDGLSTLTDEGLKQVCHHRGLEEVLYSNEALREWMTEWLELTSQVKPESNVSFTAHSAVFKALNYQKDQILCQEENSINGSAEKNKGM